MERRTHILLALTFGIMLLCAAAQDVNADDGENVYYLFGSSASNFRCYEASAANALYTLHPGECAIWNNDFPPGGVSSNYLRGCDSRSLEPFESPYVYELSWELYADAACDTGGASVYTTSPLHYFSDSCSRCAVSVDDIDDFERNIESGNVTGDVFDVYAWRKYTTSGYVKSGIKICYFPAIDMCPDGDEILPAPVAVYPEGIASTYGITTTETAQIRYTIITSPTEVAGVVRLQDSLTFPFYYENTAIITDTIPHRSGFTLTNIGGGQYRADFEIENTGNISYTLFSVCLIRPKVTDYCPEGFELLNDDDIFMPRLGEPFDFYGVIPYSDYQLRFRLLNPTPDGTSIYAAVQANSGSWSLKGNPGEEIITRTIPTRGTISGENLDLEVTNTYDDFYLQSICAIERVPLPEFTCDHFYDFQDGISGWEQSPGTGANWASGEEDGALRILGDGHGGDATVLTYVERGAWEMVMSARSYASSTNVIYGFVGAQFPYTDSLRTAILTEEYAQLRATGIVSGYAKIQTQHAYVDWICLVNHDKSSEIPMLPVPTCGLFPTFEDHPDFSITEIGDWIYWAINKILDIMKWLVCQIVAAVNTAANWIIKQIAYVFGKLNLPVFPEIPDNLFDLSAWLEWMRQSASIILAWVYRQIRNAFESVVNIASWAGRWWGDFARWLASWWIYGLSLILEHFLALFGIEIDPMALWRDFKIFIDAVGEEIGYEFDSLLLLLNDVGEVFGVIFTGWWGSLSGDATQDFGQGMGGLGGFIWRGVAWVGEAIDGTPLTALNFVSMGVLAWGLFTHTTEKISKIFSRLFSLSSE
jgi:hypothetical protein